jgi:serine/threonine protein kinase
MIGTKLDRFELIAELASGGMGTVFLARLGGAGGFQRLYAIKRLHEHLARHTEFIEMFLDEARLAARIHHPNVVPILEIGTTDAGYYLVMEYVEGDTAGHLFHCASQEEKVVGVRVAIRIVLDVLAGLHAAHEGTDDEGRSLELVHRDVSPHNILVSVDGVSRITDFGIARAASRLAVTRTGQLKGKIAYMAPEQARSEKIDRRADVFAMGICFWEMLARQRLFKAEAEGETLNRLLYEPIPSVRSVDPGIPRELDEIVAKALTRDLDKRYATAAEFSDALEEAARSLDLLASHREVAACIADVLAPDLSERRADLRAWLADTERRSLVPSADSSGDVLNDRPQGAMVSTYVPPLFEPGALRASAKRSRSRRRGGGPGLPLVMAVAVALALVVGGVRWWRGQSRVAAATVAASSLAAVPVPLHATAVSPPVMPPADDARTEALPGAPAPDPVVPPLPSPSPPSRTAVLSASEKAPVIAVVRPPRAQVVQSPGPAPGAGPAGSVPPEMLYNPYR